MPRNGSIAAPRLNVADGQNQPLSSWPKYFSGTDTPTLVWDAASTLAGADGDIQVRAAFSDSSGSVVYTTPAVTAKLDQKAGGTHDATISIGPGTVDLVTGNFNISEDDVALGAYNSDLTLTRTYNSRDPNPSGSNTALGPGWATSLPVDAAASAYAKLVLISDPDYGDQVTITNSDGTQFVFDGYDGQYWPESGNEDLWLTRRTSAGGSDDWFELSDLDGNTTVFRPDASGSSTYLPREVWQPGTSSGDRTTTLTYDGSGRVTRMFSPTADFGICGSDLDNPNDRKCRFLSFAYTQVNGSTRLDHVDFTAWDPERQPAPGFNRWTVAQYSYDASEQNPHLIAEWDPRIRDPITGTFLKETYGYDSAGRLSTVTPPGELAWTLNYQSVPGYPQSDPGRLRSVSRPALAPASGNAVTTIVYGVPLGGGSAPDAMQGGDVARWGQSDVPTDATAIFPPDQIPPAPPTMPTSYQRATIFYLDARGRSVNVASPGGHIATTEWDKFDNVVRTLSPANRELALAARGDTAARSRELDTQRSYNADGIDLQSELGPLHAVQIDGQSQPGRTHMSIHYDEGLPDGKPPMHLATTVTEGAQVANQTSDLDQRTTRYSYRDDNDRGYDLRQPTSQTVDPGPGALNLKSRAVYAANGLVQESRMAANPDGGDAHTTKTIYYGSDASLPQECQARPEWTNLPCETLPAAQPSTSGVPGPPKLPVTRYEYNALYQVDKEIETVSDPSGDATRTTTTHYDAAGRVQTVAVSSSEAATVPTISSDYDPQTGRLTTTRDGTRLIMRRYDQLGRLNEYDDADGGKTTQTYDLLDRPLTTTDYKPDGAVLGTHALGYDATTGLPTQLTDTTLSMTATYNADGNITLESYGNGLQEQTTYDETGTAMRLCYFKGASCGASGTWFDFNAKYSAHDQIVSEQNSLQGQNFSSEAYTYDNAGRLTQVQDTPTTDGCTTRVYTYNSDSDRTSMTTRPPLAGGGCDTASGGQQVTYQYDEADRLTNTGFAYDKFGRTLTVPQQYAGGQAITATYYADDRAHTVTQFGYTHTLDLDPAHRIRVRSGSDQPTETLHYGDDSDSPNWIATPTYSQRNVEGIDGELAAIHDSRTGVALQLVNLHGDVVGTAANDSTAPDRTFESSEFGAPRDTSVVRRYAWLGGKQRQAEFGSGLVDMGVRLYVPQLGRFLQPDPVPGGSANAYDYAGQDPLNKADLNGLKKHHHHHHSEVKVQVQACNLPGSMCNQAARIAARTAKAALARSRRKAKASNCPCGPMDAWKAAMNAAAKAAQRFFNEFAPHAGPFPMFVSQANAARSAWNAAPPPVKRCVAAAATAAFVIGLSGEFTSGQVAKWTGSACVGAAVPEPGLEG